MRRICRIVVVLGLFLFGGCKVAFAAENQDGSVAVNEVNFPDASFREYVRKMYDKNENLVLEKEERETVYQMSVGYDLAEEGEGFWSPTGKYSLQGIEYFPGIQELEIKGISNLSGNVSGLPELQKIIIEDVEGKEAAPDEWGQKLPLSQIKSLKVLNFKKGDLDLSGWEQLENFYLDFESDELKNFEFGMMSARESEEFTPEYYSGMINLRNNKKLKTLYLSYARLDALDISQNENLAQLHLFETYFRKKSLNVSRKKHLQEIIIQKAGDLESLTVSGNEKLKHITLENMSQLKKLKLTGNKALRSLWFEKITALKKLDLSGNKRVEEINLYDVNALSKLDVRKNKLLKSLTIHGRGPHKLDLSKNRKLRELDVTQEVGFILPENNKLRRFTVQAMNTTIDLSSCTALRSVKNWTYGYGAKIKMKRTVFKKLWKSRKLKFTDNNRTVYTVKNKKVKLKGKGKYIIIRI